MSMSRQEIVSAVLEMAEDRLKKMTLDAWLEIELARIINRKKYWWRKKLFALSSVAATREYNLDATGLNVADDFHQMVELNRWDSDSSHPRMTFVSDAAGITLMQYGATTGPPTSYTIKPGTSKTLLLYPITTSAAQYYGMYWASLNAKWNTQGALTIPLIPEDYHYVALLALQKRAFFYLYGQKDPRFAVAVADLAEGIKDLDGYKAPTTEVALEMRSGDPDIFVRSTGR